MQYILVHGLSHGGWCWEHTRAVLEASGHGVIAPDLPLTSLDDDAALIASLVETHAPVVLVGHSYGGLVISQAAARTRGTITHLVYLAAAMFGAEDDYPALMAEYQTPLSANLTTRDGDYVTVQPHTATAAFYSDCPDAVARTAVARLRPTNIACITPTGPPAEPWRETPSLFIVCTRDKAMPPEAQAILARKADKTIHLDTDHSPFYSANEALCAALTEELPIAV